MNKVATDFDRLLAELKELGYETEYFVLNTKDTPSRSFPNKIPQNRERVFALSRWVGKE